MNSTLVMEGQKPYCLEEQGFYSPPVPMRSQYTLEESGSHCEWVKEKGWESRVHAVYNRSMTFTHTCAISHIMYCKVFWNHTRGGQRFISILSHIHMQFFFIDTVPVKKWYHLSGTASSVFDHLRYLELQVDNFSEKLGVWYVVCMHVMSRQQSPVLLHISADGQHIPKGPERFPSVLCVLY